MTWLEAWVIFAPNFFRLRNRRLVIENEMRMREAVGNTRELDNIQHLQWQTYGPPFLERSLIPSSQP